MISASLSRKRRFRAEGALRETGCSSSSLAVCTHTCGNRPASQKSRRPGPLEIEPTDPAVAVENLTDQMEARHQLGFHRPEVDFSERHATGCDLGIVPTSIVVDWEFKFGQRSEQTISIFSWQLCNRRL